MNTDQRLFIQKSAAAARMVAHPFPEMAACEAALESNYGRSILAAMYFNYFGMKARKHEQYGVVTLPTQEFLHGEWQKVDAPFVKYPSADDCFADRINTLTRLASVYPEYKAALESTTPEDYIRHVSKTWSTDPARADKVLLIYRQYMKDAPQIA